jgi:hypothetical protein
MTRTPKMNRGVLRQRAEDLRKGIARWDGENAEALARARMLRAWTLWLLGEQEESWRELDRLEEMEREAPGDPPRIWDGSPLAGRSLLLGMRTGGLGDLMQFARFLVPIEPREAVTVFTKPAVARLLSSSLPSGFTWKTEVSDLPPTDLRLDWYRLPLALRWTYEEVAASVPYLRPEADLGEAWRARLAAYPRPWIGVFWSTRGPRERNDSRSAPLVRFAPLINRPGATFFSLEKEDRPGEIRAAGLEKRLVSFGDAIGNLDDTAALVSHLDLVVTIDTSIAHLAGALGVPVWVLLMERAFEGWLLGKDSESTFWYPTARLFRQSVQNDWDELVQRVSVRLDEWLRTGEWRIVKNSLGSGA